MKAFVVIALCIVSTLAKPHYYSHSKPDIRIESYTNAPPAPLPPTTPAPPADPPMHTSYGYQSYHHPAIVVVADEPKPSGHGYQAPPPPPADTPNPMEYGYNHETFVKSSVPTATIVRQFVRTDNAGTYNLDVESSDGSTHVESGSLKNLGHPEGPTSVKEGSYAFTSPEGKRFTVTYTADENGFIARGDHLPTSPPIPEEIQKSLALPRVESSSSDSSPPMHHHHYGYSAPPAFRYDSKSYH